MRMWMGSDIIEEVVGSLVNEIRDTFTVSLACKKILEDTINNEEKRKKYVDEGAIVAISHVLLFHKENKHIQERACAALCSISTGYDGGPEIINTGACVAIGNAMVRNQYNPGVVRSAAGAIENLAASRKEVAEEFLTIGAAGRVIELMDIYISNPDIISIFVRILCIFSIHETSRLVLLKRGVKPITNAMNTYKADEGIQQNGCSALGFIFSYPSLVTEKLDAQVPQMIINAMHTHNYNADLVGAACGAVQSLSMVHQSHPLFKSLNTGQQIIDALMTHKTNKWVQARGIGALDNLAYNDDDNKELFMNLGVPTIVVEAINYHTKSDSVHEQSLALFRSMSMKNDQNKAKMLRLGIDKEIVKAINCHKMDGSGSSMAYGALLVLGVDKKYKPEMEKAGENILKYLTDPKIEPAGKIRIVGNLATMLTDTPNLSYIKNLASLKIAIQQLISSHPNELAWVNYQDSKAGIAGDVVLRAISDEDLNSNISTNTTGVTINTEKKKEYNTLLLLKENGNELFKNKQYIDAIDEYSNAIAIITSMDSSNSSIDKDAYVMIMQLLPSLYSNRSACFMGLNKYDEALNDADSCIDGDPTWSRGYSRRGAAMRAKSLFKEAADAYSKAAELELNNKMKQEYILNATECKEEATRQPQQQVGSNHVPATGIGSSNGNNQRRPSLLQRLSGMVSSSFRRKLLGLSSGMQSTYSSSEQQKEKRPSLLKRLSNAFTLSSKKENTEQSSIVALSAPSATTSINSNGIPLTGVSLRWFIDFIETDEKVKNVLHKKGRGAKMDDLLSVVKDMTSEVDESFAEMLLRTQPNKKLTKPTADVFISYARLYLVSDMIPAIQTLLPTDDKDKDIYIWMDSLAINQRVKSEFDPDFFIKTLKQGIETISNVAVVLTPWNDPGNLTRAWCIWELYSAAESKDVSIQVLIPPTQRKPFRDALINDPQQLMARMGKIDVEKAQAWSAKDRDMILNAARKAEGGIQGVRESVIQPLRSWMANEALEMVIEIDKSIEDGNDGYDKSDQSHALNRAGMLLFEQGKYDQAETIFRRELQIDKEFFGVNHEKTASAINFIVAILKEKGKYDEAEIFAKIGLEIREKVFGPDHASTSIGLNALANIYELQSKLTEAEELYRRALAIDEKVYGNDHPEFATDLNNLAGLLLTLRRTSEAEDLLKRAVGITENIYGKNHPKMLSSLSNLAMLLKFQNKIDEAELILRRVLAIHEKAYGNNHPHNAMFLENLSTLLQDQGKHDEAGLLFRRALDIDEKAYGKNHPNVAIHLHHLAKLLKYQGKYDEAVVIFKQELEIYENEIEIRKLPMLECLSLLAESLMSLGKYEEAAQSYRRVIVILETDSNPNYVYILTITNNLSSVLMFLGQFEEAELNFRKALSIIEQTELAETEHVATIHCNIGHALKKQKKYNAAEKEFRIALELREKMLGTKHELFLNCFSNLVETLGYQGKMIEGTELIIKYQKDGN